MHDGPAVMPTTPVIVFDLDDTLYPERAYAMSGFVAVAEAFADRFGNPTDAAAEMSRLFDTEHRGHVFDEICRLSGMSPDPQLIGAMVEVYRRHPPRIKPHPDADAAIQRLARRARLALISDGPLIMQEAKVAALSLRSRIELVVFTDQWGRSFWKPHPRAFEHVQDHFGADGESCTYIADNAKKDFLAPRALGWRTVQIQRPGGIYTELPPAPGGAPDHCVASLDEIDDLIA
jgi:putative hydrolase of the HAD superfamily